MRQRTALGRPGAHRPGRSVAERLHRTVKVDKDDRLRLPGGFVPAHAGRVGRHSCKRDANRFGLLIEQSNKRANGNMALGHIAIDECGMARGRFSRNPHISLECREVWVFLQVDFRSVVL